MKLNTEIKIFANYNKDTDSNSVSFSCNLDTKVIDVLTTIEMAKNSLEELIQEVHYKTSPKNSDKWLRKITLKDLYAAKENS